MRGWFCFDCNEGFVEPSIEDCWSWDEFQGERFRKQETSYMCPICNGYDIEEIDDLCPKCRKDRIYEDFSWCHSCIPPNFLEDEMREVLNNEQTARKAS